MDSHEACEHHVALLHELLFIFKQSPRKQIFSTHLLCSIWSVCLLTPLGGRLEKMGVVTDPLKHYDVCFELRQ